MMLSYRKFYLLISVLLFCLVSLKSYAEGIPPDLERIIKQGKLTVALYKYDIPPFFMKDKQGQLVGYDISIANDLGKRLGIPVVFDREASSYDEVIDRVATGKADIGISLLSQTLPRALKVSFSKPYLVLDKILIVNRLKAAQLEIETDPLKQLARLNDKSIKLAVLANSSYVEFAKQRFPNATLVPYNHIADAVTDLESGKIFGIFFDKLQIQNLLSKNPEAALYFKTLTFQGETDPIAIAVPWRDIYLLNWINLYVDTILSDGTLANLNRTYLQGNP